MVTYLIENQLVSHLVVVDKVPPAMAWLNPKQKRSFDNPKVEFRSANLLNPGETEEVYL